MTTAPRRPNVRRRAYRVRPDSLEELDLAVLERRFKVVRGEVADVASGGVQVSFDAAEAPAIDAGGEVLLAVASERYDVDATLNAVLVDSREVGGRRACRFAFDADEPLADCDTALFALFNRRAAWRCPAADAGEVGVRALPAGGAEGEPHALELTDVSALGLCCRVHGPVPEWLRAADTLEIEVVFPEGGAERLPCHVVRRATDATTLACAFDWNAVPDAAARATRVVGRVLERMAADRRLAPDRRHAPPSPA